ncbi:MAG: cell division protein FtsZ [Prevotellaceae bacterium]|jgi:cell division protein FtsZ|nr:cell division protein FtsZ [Prevotellaceae bacterium]
MNGSFIPIGWNDKSGSIIKVIGVGGGGNNAVTNMYNKGIEGVDFIICNTDAQALMKSPVPCKIQLGAKLTEGLGAGCDPEIGRQAALESLDEIKKALADNAKMVFITTGLGGGTGTGAAPIIAEAAKEMGILTVAIATLPFQDEGQESSNRALDGKQKLKQHVDSLLIIDSQRLYEIYPDISVFDAFPKADDIVATAAKSIAELITKQGEINVDFADVKMVMKNGGMALMGFGKASGEGRAKKAAEEALNSPLLNDNDISGAKKSLVNISSGLKNPIKMAEMGEIMDFIRQYTGNKVNFKRGVMKDESLDDENSDAEITVTIIATGFANSFDDYDREDRDIIKPVCVNLDDEQSDNEIHIKSAPNIIELTSKPELELAPVSEITVKTIERSPSSPASTASQSGTSSVVRGPLKEEDIARMEKIPAFERNKTKIVMGNATGEVSKHRLDEIDGSHTLGENNSYLDRDVD